MSEGPARKVDALSPCVMSIFIAQSMPFLPEQTGSPSEPVSNHSATSLVAQRSGHGVHYNITFLCWGLGAFVGLEQGKSNSILWQSNQLVSIFKVLWVTLRVDAT